MENKYCVYVHKRCDNNEVIYVGSGNKRRPYVTSKRSKEWFHINNSVGINIEVVLENLSKRESLVEEQKLLDKYPDTINLKRTVSKPFLLCNIDFKSSLVYDETSESCLRWLLDINSGNYGSSWARVKAGDVAGYKNKFGVWSVTLNRVTYTVHRVVLCLNGEDVDSKDCVDHLNGNPSDNRLCNLRATSFKENMRNKKTAPSNTGVVGVIRLATMNGTKTKVNNYFKARWSTLTGEENSKHFNIDKLGEAEAFRLACEYRKQMIEELNEQGAGYTTRHGT